MFYINIAIGILAVILLRMVPRDKPDVRAERFDIPGALLFTFGLVALLLGMFAIARGWPCRPAGGALVGGGHRGNVGAMNIDREGARRIAELAHLELDDPALERMASEMTKILTYIDQLREVDVAGFEERGDAETPLRDDVPHATLPREAVERNAPSWRDGFFVVPKVIGGD